jgi:hypothetical protein
MQSLWPDHILMKALFSSDNDTSEDEADDSDDEDEKFLGISVPELQRADIEPAALCKPKAAKSWVWAHVALPATRLRSADDENKRRAEMEEPLPPLHKTAPHHHPKQWFCSQCFLAGKTELWRGYTSPGSVANHLNRKHGLSDSAADFNKYFHRKPAETTNDDIDSALLMAMARDNRLAS